MTPRFQRIIKIRYVATTVTLAHAGAWPCGTIALVLLVAELFGSESKSQVYGSLHTFVQENHEASSDLCKNTTTAPLERIQFTCYIFSCI